MIDFFVIDIAYIHSDIPRNQFQEIDIESYSNQIIEIGTLLSPLIVTEISVDQYKLVDRHLEFYAVIKAQEKFPDQFESVNSFVIDNNSSLDLSYLKSSCNEIESPTNLKTNVDKNNLDERQIPKGTTLNEIQKLVESGFASQEKILKGLEHSLSTKKTENNQLLDFINTSTLKEIEYRLELCRVKKSTISSILETRKYEKFVDYNDLIIRTKGLAEKSLITLMDKHNYLNSKM